MAENPVKENIQGVEIHLVKLNNNRRKADCASLGRTQKGGADVSPTNPEKYRTDKRAIINVDRHINELIVEKDMCERMTPEEP